MEQKINIAEILDGCHKGTKLYSPIFGDVHLEKIRPHLAVVVTTESNDKEEFLYDGRYGINGECVLFPSKDQRDWSKFQRPFKDGDIVVAEDDKAFQMFILKEVKYHENDAYIGYCHFGCDFNSNKLFPEGFRAFYRLATETEKEKLFQVIKDNGFKWNSETKTLEKLIQPKFKDGDIIYVESKDYSPGLISIFKEENSLLFYDYCATSLDCKSFYLDNIYGLIRKEDIAISRLATPEEEQILFDAIKKNGYKWNPETKTLEKLVEPNFKIGDTITNGVVTSVIKQITKDSYILDIKDSDICFNYVFFENQDNWKLVPKKFDITTLTPFESKVLVRNSYGDIWRPAIYGFTDSEKHYVVGGNYWIQCVPYEVNKELLGTTNNPE